jgi:hypothetical protein
MLLTQLQLLNICPYFHELDPILGERSSTQPQLTTDGMFDNKDGLFDEMDDKDQDPNKQAEEETKDKEHNDDQSSSSSSTSINNVPTLSRSNSRLTTSNRSMTARRPPSKVAYNKTKKKH